MNAEDQSRPFASVKAIFFDLDDTLCAYWDASKAGLRRAFEQCGPPGYPIEDLLTAWATVFRSFAPNLKNTSWFDVYLKTAEPTRTEQMRLTLERVGINDLELSRKLSQAYMAERDANLKLFSDAIPVLNAL